MYQAIISRVTVKPHPNADRLLLGDVRGYQVVVGLDTKDGDLGLYFPTDGQLSEEYCKANDLIRRKNPETGAIEGGMFDANRRVRSQKFRGEPSEGYFAPISSLAFIDGFDAATLKEGALVTEIHGVPICQKYVTPATKSAGGGFHSKSRQPDMPLFPKHPDTPQLRFEIENIPKGSLIYFIEKKHGTSARLANIPVAVPPTGWKKFFPKTFTKREYQAVHGTKNVVLVNKVDTYYKDDFRVNVFNSLKDLIHKDEILYGEIVGYTTDGRPIMPPVSTDALKDKDFTKRYGSSMGFTYGCGRGMCEFWLYRVVHINEDGDKIELPWAQVCKRAKELGVKYGPEYADPILYDGDKTALLAFVNSLVEGPSLIDDSHIREGVILQIETPNGHVYWLKHKSFAFGVLEGYIKDQADVVDMEESA